MGVETIIAGAVLGAAAQSIRNKANRRSAQANADFFNEQAELADISGKREEILFRRESEQLEGAQIGAFAKAGVDLSGSPLLVLAHSSKLANEEILAIRENRSKRVRAAKIRAEDAQANADLFGSAGFNFLTIGGTILGGAGSAIAASK